MMVEEMVYRGGGLALVSPIHIPNLMPNVRPYAMTTMIERLPGLATITLEKSGIQPGDCLIIHSVSARIPIVIEMAMKAKEKGIHLSLIHIYWMDCKTSQQYYAFSWIHRVRDSKRNIYSSQNSRILLSS